MKILLTGGSGLLGNAIQRVWASERPFDTVFSPRRSECNLGSRDEVEKLIDFFRPDLIIHTAAEVAGIQARISSPTKYLLSNSTIDTNLISCALNSGVTKLVNFGSAAMYPANSIQPIREESLFTAPFEKASESYGLAKATSTKLTEYISKEFGLSYRTLVPSNIYGIEKTRLGYSPHLISAAIQKIESAIKEGNQIVGIWGDGQSRREFVFARDIASWLTYSIDEIFEWPSTMNIGFGKDYSILQYYAWAAEATGYKGEFELEPHMPNGVRSRLLDSSQARNFGWKPATEPLNGIQEIVHSKVGRFN